MLLTAVKADFYSSQGQSRLEKSDLDKVFFHAVHFSDLGIPELNEEYKRPVLTISCNGKKIYRQFKQGSTYRIKKGQIAILDKDRKYLGIKGDEVSVEVKKANFFGKFMYYYKNPRQEFRIGFILGLMGLVPTVVEKLRELLSN